MFSWEMLLNILVMWFVASGLLIVLYARHELVSAWLEPALRRPVLIIESDDWGAGTTRQADALGEIARVLVVFTDRDGRRPVMTLGLILATADGEKIQRTGRYHRTRISESTHMPLLKAIGDGVEAGVFHTQLHGLEHFWPPALMAASETDETVKAWLCDTPDVSTEDLPSPLQSRWVDASVLPSRPLAGDDINQAVQEEVSAFQAVFGRLPDVVVPPTFIWNKYVEQAWAGAGVGVIVTPGCRYEGRDAQGLPTGAGMPVRNGQQGEDGTVYLVRDVYFEPALGHTAAQAVSALATKVRLGRPALLETHRFNFLGDDDTKRQALDALKALLQDAVTRFPELAFLSTAKLASVLGNRDPEWVENRVMKRLHTWLTRLGELSRIRKLACLSGWIVPAWLVWKLTG